MKTQTSYEVLFDTGSTFFKQARTDTHPQSLPCKQSLKAKGMCYFSHKRTGFFGFTAGEVRNRKYENAQETDKKLSGGQDRFRQCR